jgi:hypothetical protein
VVAEVSLVEICSPNVQVVFSGTSHALQPGRDEGVVVGCIEEPFSLGACVMATVYEVQCGPVVSKLMTLSSTDAVEPLQDTVVVSVTMEPIELIVVFEEELVVAAVLLLKMPVSVEDGSSDVQLLVVLADSVGLTADASVVPELLDQVAELQSDDEV